MARQDSSLRIDHRRQFDIVAAVGIGGAIGVLARYGIAVAFPVESHQFPWSTLVINLSGSFLLGVAVVFIERRPPNRFFRPFLTIGVLGGFTTFSTFAVEVVQLILDHPWVAMSYLAASIGGGGFCVLVGATALRQFYDRSCDRPPKGART